MSLIEKLLNASKRGDIKSVQSLLLTNEININCEDILILKFHDIQNFFFIIFKFLIIFGI